MTYVTVAEIAAKCGVTPQGVNAYLRKSGLQKQAIKRGNKFLLDSDLAEKVETHFGLIDPLVSDLDSETTTKTETFTETSEIESETVTETTETDKTPDKAAILQVELDQLRIRLEEKQSQIDYLQTQLDKATDLNRALTLENAAYAAKLLKAPEEDQEPKESEEIEIQEEETESAGDQPDQPQEQKPRKVMTFGEWFKQRFFS